MPSTTNFGWTTPADTDYVKDGANAIRTLGNGIDTSLVDLKGGTTGQILSKASNTDLDYTWINNDQGDITNVGVTAPITGGGSSGSVTIGIQDATTTQKGAVQLENSTSSTSTTTAAVPASVKSAYDLADAAIPKSLVDAKGDLIVATADNTPTRLAVGATNGHLLTIDSSTATGLKWAAAPSSTPTFIGCYAYAPNSNNQSVNDSTATVVNLESELFDTDGFHSTSSNTGRITIPSGKGGKYLVTGQVALGGGSGFTGQGAREIYLMKNGTATYLFSNYPMVNTVTLYPSYMYIHTIVDLVATDYIQMMIAHNQGTATQIRGDGYSVGSTFLAVQYLGA